MGVRVDDHAVKAEWAHDPLDFRRGALRLLRCDAAKAGQARGVLRDHADEFVVVRGGQLGGPGRVVHLHTGCVQAQQVHIDAGLVHDPEAFI